MKKFLCIIFLILIVVFTNYSQEKKVTTDFRLILNFYAYPYFYEFTNKMNSNSFNGSIFLGMKLNQFSVGIEVFENYVSLSDQDKSLNYMGAWNIFGSTIDFFYKPINWFELKVGLGGSWYKSAFSNSIVGTFSKSLGGLTILFDGTFKPPFKYIDFSIINRIDLIFSTMNTNPIYTGKIRVNFYPYFNWINLYLEAGILIITYNGIPRDINTATVVWGTGISFDLIIPSMFKYKKNRIKSNNEEIEDKNEPLTNVELEEEKKIEELKKVKEGDSVIFTNIIFYHDSDKIKEESFPILDKIIEVLKERSNINIKIIGHTNDVNKPQNELYLSKKRAEMVKNYFIKKGINSNRMTAIGYGSQFTKNLTIDEANRKVEIKIVEIK